MMGRYARVLTCPDAGVPGMLMTVRAYGSLSPSLPFADREHAACRVRAAGFEVIR